MAGRRVYGGSNMTVILQNDGIPCSTEALDALLISTSSSTFHGSRSMVNFEDVRRGGKTAHRLFFRPFDQEANGGDDDLDEFFHQPEKKRRLTTNQVQFLERNFELENKLEPDRKVQLAKDLGLQPRQVAIWFQNRRARWKTKQLEKDYEALRANYDTLKADYDILLKEKEELKSEVSLFSDKLLLKEKGRQNSESSDPNEAAHVVQSQTSIPNSISEKKVSNLPIVICKQEDLSSAKSDVFDSDSPRYTDGLEPADSSHVFEPDQSDLSSQDEEEYPSPPANWFSSSYNFPKFEDVDYPNPPANSINFGFPAEDQTFCFWS